MSLGSCPTARTVASRSDTHSVINDTRKPLIISVGQDTNAIWLTPRDHKHLALSVDGCSFLREVWRYWIKTATVSDKKAYLCSLQHVAGVTMYEHAIHASRKRILAEVAVAHTCEWSTQQQIPLRTNALAEEPLWVWSMRGSKSNLE